MSAPALKYLKWPLLLAFLIAFASPAVAQAWREANREAVQYTIDGEFPKAMRSATRAVKLYKDFEEFDLAEFIRILQNRINIAVEARNQKKEIQFTKAAIKEVVKLVGEENLEVLDFYQQLAEAYDGRGKYKEARRTTLRLIHIGKSVFGETDYRIAEMYLYLANRIKKWRLSYTSATGDLEGFRLGQVLPDRGNRQAEILRYLYAARDIMRENYPFRHPTYVLVEFETAKAELEFFNYRKAEQLYLELLSNLETVDKDPREVQSLILSQLLFIYARLADDANYDATLAKLTEISDDGDLDSVPLLRVQPEYPVNLQGSGLGAWVEVEFDISEQGNVINARVIDSEGGGSFERAALRAIKKWFYRPLIIDGIAYAQTEVRESFRFQDRRVRATASRIER